MGPHLTAIMRYGYVCFVLVPSISSSRWASCQIMYLLSHLNSDCVAVDLSTTTVPAADILPPSWLFRDSIHGCYWPETVIIHLAITKRKPWIISGWCSINLLTACSHNETFKYDYKILEKMCHDSCHLQKLLRPYTPFKIFIYEVFTQEGRSVLTLYTSALQRSDCTGLHLSSQTGQYHGKASHGIL